MPKTVLGLKLSELMTKHGVTRQMLSESIHVSLAAVYRIMDGTRKPSASHLNRLVQYFSVLENNPNIEQELRDAEFESRPLYTIYTAGMSLEERVIVANIVKGYNQGSKQ